MPESFDSPDAAVARTRDNGTAHTMTQPQPSTGFLPAVALLALAGTAGLLPAPAEAATSFEGRVYYFGDLHAHSGYSVDGGSSDLNNCNGSACGDVADFFGIARNEAGLDFCAISDHVNDERSMDSSSWPLVVQLVNEANDPEGGFVSILGAELNVETSSGQRYGHRNLYFFSDEAVLNGIPFDALAGPGRPDDCDGMWQSLAELASDHGPLLYLPHHPIAAMPEPTDWSCQDSGFAPVVEIYSAHGNSHADPSVDPYDPVWGGSVEGSSVSEALDLSSHGHRIGIIGGTDLHDTRPGMICHLDGHMQYLPYGGSLTGLFLDEGVTLNRTGIYDALVRRHTYATTGPKVPTQLALLASDGTNLAVMGDILPSIESLPVTLQLTVPESFSPHVTGVELLDGAAGSSPMAETAVGVYSLELGEASFPWLGYAVVTVDGASYWAAQGVACTDHGPDALGQDDIEKLWTSPLWIEDLVPPADEEPADEEPADATPSTGLGRTNSGGCACSLRSDAATGSILGLLLVPAWLRRTRSSAPTAE